MREICSIPREVHLEAQIEGWGIVVAGNWNVSIFNPNWVSENIFDKAEVQVEFPLTPGLSPRYTRDGVSVFLQGERLNLCPEQANDQCLKAVEDKAKRILDLLPHTPVNAVGINFIYKETDPKPGLSAMFNFQDTGRLDVLGFNTQVREIGRQLAWNAGMLNLTMRISNAGSILFNFNYHEQVASTVEAANAIAGQVVSLEHKSRTLLDKLYGGDQQEEI
jgi:hypothetical protein